jgi:hypothetical protein
MGKAKRNAIRAHNAIRAQEVAAAHKKLTRKLLLRSLYFHVLPLILIIVAAATHEDITWAAVAGFGVCMILYVRLSIRDGAIFNSGVYERENEPVYFWFSIGLFALLGLLALGLAIIALYPDRS